MYVLISDNSGTAPVVRGYFNTIEDAKEYALNENLQDIAIYLLSSDINFANYKCVEDYKSGECMNYKQIIKQAAEKREVEMNNLRKEQDKELVNYMEQIKNLAPRIKELLSIEQELNDNLFKYDILCTDSMYHRLGFVKGKDGLGVYGGGCLGEFNLIVDRNGVAYMVYDNKKRNPVYADIWFLNRFVNDFSYFETKVWNFIKAL